MSTRRRAREIVLQLLYEADVNGTRDQDESKKFIRSRLQGRKALTEFACQLLAGTVKRREEIDTQITQLSANWAMSRMPVVDRNVLRLGAYEVLFAETPAIVAVNESVVLAKRYGDKNSARFVNGVLDRLMKQTGQDTSRSPKKGGDSANTSPPRSVPSSRNLSDRISRYRPGTGKSSQDLAD